MVLGVLIDDRDLTNEDKTAPLVRSNRDSLADGDIPKKYF